MEQEKPMHAIAFTFLAAVTNRRRTATTESDTAVVYGTNHSVRLQSSTQAELL